MKALLSRTCVAPPELSPELVTGVLGVQDSTPRPHQTNFQPSDDCDFVGVHSVPVVESSSQLPVSGRSNNPQLQSMERRYYPTHRGENKADQTFHSFGRHGDHTAQASFPYSPRATKHVPGLTHQSAESTPEPHGLRLTPASMRSGFIEYQQMCEQPHGETPASDITSQPVQPIHSFASGDTSSCTVSAAVRVPTSPDEDNTAESPAKGLSGLRCSAEEPFLAAMPLQTIMENISTTDTGDVVRKGRQSSPSGKRRNAASYITPTSSWGDFSPAHTVGELTDKLHSPAVEVVATQSPATAQRQTPCLKRSRSVVADVGGSNAFCMSTGYTVRQPLDTGVTIRPATSPASVGDSAARIYHADGTSPPSTDASNRRLASAPLARQALNSAALNVVDSTQLMSTGSVCMLQQELTLATPPCDGLQRQDYVAGGAPDTSAPQNAMNVASCYTTGGEQSVHNPAFAASGASGTNWGANRTFDGLKDVRQQWLGSAHAGSSHRQAADLDKSLFAPLQLPCADENAQPPRPTSTELVMWSPQQHANHRSPATADNACSAAVVAASQRGSDSPSHFRNCQSSPLRDDRLNELHLHGEGTPGPLAVAVQCGPGPSRTEFRTAVVHSTDLQDAVNSAMPRRQLQVVQQFVAESVVPTLAQCALTPVEHTLGPLATQAMGMLDHEAKAGVEPCLSFLQSAVARLEDTAARTHELNAQLSATRAELRAAEFELKVVRAENTAAWREVRACERENDCMRKEAENAQAGGFARTEAFEALEDELADASSAREVLALALARLLRDTKAHQPDRHPEDSTNPVAALETQLNNLSVRDSTISAPAQCNDLIASSLAAARKILGTDPDVPAALQSSSPVFMEHRGGQGRQIPGNSVCLESQVLRFAASCDHSRSPHSPPADASTSPPVHHSSHPQRLPSHPAEQLLMTASTDGVRQGSPACDASAFAPPFQREDSVRRSVSPMSNPMRTPSSMADSGVAFGSALPGLSPIHDHPTSARSSPVADCGSPLVFGPGGQEQAEEIPMVPTRARTPDCFMDRMCAATASDVDVSAAAPSALMQCLSFAPDAAAQCHDISQLSHFQHHSDAARSASLAVPDHAQQTQPQQQRDEAHPQPPCLAQSPHVPGQQQEPAQPISESAKSGKGRLHIPADVCGSKDESDHDRSQAWQRSLGMSYVADSHTAPFSVLPQRRPTSQDGPTLALVQGSNDSNAQKQLIDLDAIVPVASPAVDAGNRPAHTLLSQHSLIDADVPLTIARGHTVLVTNQTTFQPFQPATVSEAPQQNCPVLDLKEFTAALSSQQVQGSTGQGQRYRVGTHVEPGGPGLQLASPPPAAPRLGVYPDVAASPEVDHNATGALPSASAQAAALEVRRFCAMAEQQTAAQPWDVEDKARRQKKGKARVVVPTSPDLETAKRAQRAAGDKLTASQERVRASMGRKRATVLAGHFGGSYAAKAKARGGTGSGYAALAAKARKRRA